MQSNGFQFFTAFLWGWNSSIQEHKNFTKIWLPTGMLIGELYFLYDYIQCHPFKVREFHQIESCWISAILWRISTKKVLLTKKCYPYLIFLYKNTLLVSQKPSNFPFSITIQGFITFLLLHFVLFPQKESEETNGSNGTNMGSNSRCSIFQIDEIYYQAVWLRTDLDSRVVFHQFTKWHHCYSVMELLALSGNF